MATAVVENLSRGPCNLHGCASAQIRVTQFKNDFKQYN